MYAQPQDRLKQGLFGRWKTYYSDFWALRGVSIEVRPGEALGIIGRNGSGKSTLLQIIAGTQVPSEGEVEVRGRVAALLELGSGFNPEFTGRENVFLNGAILGIPRRQMRERFDEIAAFARQSGFPIMVKASAGGGGKGLRYVEREEDLRNAFERVTSEAGTKLAASPAEIPVRKNNVIWTVFMWPSG